MAMSSIPLHIPHSSRRVARPLLATAFVCLALGGCTIRHVAIRPAADCGRAGIVAGPDGQTSISVVQDCPRRTPMALPLCSGHAEQTGYVPRWQSECDHLAGRGGGSTSATPTTTTPGPAPGSSGGSAGGSGGGAGTDESVDLTSRVGEGEPARDGAVSDPTPDGTTGTDAEATSGSPSGPPAPTSASISTTESIPLPGPCDDLTHC